MLTNIKEGDLVKAKSSGSVRYVTSLSVMSHFKDDGKISRQQPSDYCHLDNYDQMTKEEILIWIKNKQPMENKERTLKISLEVAREWYKIAKQHDVSNPAMKMLLENFTKEELEGEKGYTWEESFKPGYQLDSTGLNRVVIRKCSNKVAQDHFKDQFRTEDQALSALAFAQLSHIVEKYNGNKNFDIVNGSCVCYIIHVDFTGKINYTTFGSDANKRIPSLAFINKEDVQNSLVFNKDLWKQYFEL